MLAAYNRLKPEAKNGSIFKDLRFEFLQYEPANSTMENATKLEMGDVALCSLCQSYSKIRQHRKIVFIADRDNADTNKKLSETGRTFKDWGNNVFSLILPVPNSRKTTPNICVEHMYSDETIKTFVTDEKTTYARRLYLGNEFDKRGISASAGLVCERKNKCGKDSIAIIEGSNGERVTSLTDETINLALSKTDFANLILNCQKPFDNVNFENFLELFLILKEINCIDKK